MYSENKVGLVDSIIIGGQDTGEITLKRKVVVRKWEIEAFGKMCSDQ